MSKNLSNIILTKKNILTFVVLFVSVILNFLLSGLNGVANFLFAVLMYGIIVYVIHSGWSILRKKERMNLNVYAEYFLYRVSTLLLVIYIFFGSFVFYHNNIEPASMPEFTITNGKKTVVFQGMAHIGSENFYNQIKDNIRNFKKDGYTLFFEGVKPGSKENMDKFNSLLGVQFDKKTYINLSKLYDLRAQNNPEFLNIVNDKDFNADIGIDEIISLYEKKFGQVNKSKNVSAEKLPVNISEIVDTTMKNLSPNELKLLVYVNRSIMNFIIKSENVRDTILEASDQKNLFDIILNERNKVIVENINSSKENKIYILYGLMHFNGVWKSLQEADPEWSLVSIKYFIPIN